MRTLAIAVVAASSVVASEALASLTIVANSGASQVGNLITNGSFENTAGGGPTGDGVANQRLWATGTTQNFSPFAVPTGWTSAGNTNSYALWGNDDNPPPYRLRGSDNLPDGVYAMYFGNGGMATVNMPPTFSMTTGQVTFPGNPTITPPPGFATPVVLSQTIPTVANPAPNYLMSFWASGEGSGTTSDPTGATLGIFGVQLTNVLAGDPVLYFAVPSAADNALGASFVYDFEFVPLNPLLDVDINILNYGHWDLTPYGRSATTELVIDDVRVNVPEPATLTGVALAALALIRRRSRQSPDRESRLR